MATSSTYYLDGIDLSDATSVYTDVQLTTLASDGWYSNGVIAREQIGGVLQAEEVCDDCGGPTPPPETIYVASIRLVNGDCFTGDPSAIYNARIYVESTWSRFTEVGGVLKVNNSTSINVSDLQTYDPSDPNVTVVANSQDSSATLLATNNTYLISDDSLSTTVSDVEVSVNLSAEATFTTCNQ